MPKAFILERKPWLREQPVKSRQTYLPKVGGEDNNRLNILACRVLQTNVINRSC